LGLYRIDVLKNKICDIYTQLEVLDTGISFGNFNPDEIISRQTLITDENNLEEELELISISVKCD
jgi:hypothetical protein